MDLRDKTVLLMGGSAFSQGIERYKKQTGFRAVAVGNVTGAAYWRLADEAYPIDTQDVDALTALVKEKHIGGIFVASQEASILPAVTVAENTGCHFYTTRAQWDILSDKRRFKKLLNEHGVPTIPGATLTGGFSMAELGNLTFPMLVKPADGSGARGISVCHSEAELRAAYDYALQFSLHGHVLVERFLPGLDDTFVRYHFQDGVFSVSSSFDRYVNTTQGGFGGIGIAYLHPSGHLRAYLEKYDAPMREAFRALGLKNGVITLQAFADENDDFYFYEAGYRLGGSQSYIFTDAVNRSNSLNYMLHFALTGSMADYPIAERDDPFFKKPCANLYIALRPGTITVLNGVEAVRAMPEVLNVTEMKGVGTVIEKTGSLEQVCMRLHVMADDVDRLAGAIGRVYDALAIRDEHGDDMVLERFDFTDERREAMRRSIGR